MANFDFSTLSSSDLEELFCSLLNAKEQNEGSKIIFRTFKDGKDKGIDILYSTLKKDFEIVGQVKHYYRSGYNALVTHLRNSEKQKVDKLAPNRYLFATSVDINVENVIEIRDVFRPYLRSLSDVYGKKELNNYLDIFPQIVNQQFKLWYSTTEILRRVLNYQTIGRSNEFRENDLKKRLRLYVETPALTEAKQILDRNNFIIITGEPGVGKTSTAELLLYEYIKDQYELTYIYDDIKEAEKILDDDDKKSDSEDDKETIERKIVKQIFYFDDFLGHNSVEIEKAKGSETALIKVLRRISNSQNKKFIFTTRTFILKSAVEESENLRRFNLRAKESTIKLDVYSNDVRRQLLINHAEESDLSDDYKEIIRKSDMQDFIISHPNFSPRSVEFITTKENTEAFSPLEYESFIRKNFNKPDEIWRHAYEQQISDLDRILLNTMLSFGDSVDIHDLELGYKARIDYEVKFNNFVRPFDAFRRSFKRLEGGFIVQETYNPNKLKFINPSLVDFMLGHLRDNYDEVIRISESAFFLVQLTTRLFPLSNAKNQHITSQLKERLIHNHDFFIKVESENYDRLILIILLTQNFEFEQIKTIITKLFLQIDDWSFLDDSYTERTSLLNFLEALNSEEMINLIGEKGSDMFANLFLNEYDLEKVIELIDILSKKFKLNLIKLFEQDDLYEFNDHFSSLIDEKIEDDIEDLLEYSNAQDFVDEKETAVTQMLEKFNTVGLSVRANLSDYSKYDWWDIGQSNYFQEQMQKED